MSDSYDPEFGTGANAADVAAAVRSARDRLNVIIGSGLMYIVDVVHATDGPVRTVKFTAKELRVLRFALNRALESL